MKSFLTKKNVKRIIAILAILTIAVVLAGCSNTTAPVSQSSGNWWDRYVIYNFSQFLIWLAAHLGNNYGITIIVFTIIVRVILLPLTAISLRSTTKQQKLQPEIDALRKKYPGKDTGSRQKLAEETNKLYKEAGINPYLGCLPIAVQMPFMLALYQAIYRTPQLQNGHFLWMDLGHPDPYFIMPILAAVFTFLTSYVSQMSMPPSSQNGMTKSMTYIMPIMIAIPAIGIASAISLYWVVSSLFSVIQTFILQNPFKYRREVEAERKAERERKHRIRRAYKRIGRKK